MKLTAAVQQWAGQHLLELVHIVLPIGKKGKAKTSSRDTRVGRKAQTGDKSLNKGLVSRPEVGATQPGGTIVYM